MAAINILNSELVENHPGQKGFRELRGCGNFSTTDASGTLLCRGFSVIDCVTLTPAGATNTDEQLYTTDTVNANGKIVPTSNSITIARGGTKTSGLKFFFVVRGR